MANETYYIELDINSIKPDELHKFTKRDGTDGVSLRLGMSTRREPDKFGYTHNVYVYRTREQKEHNVPNHYVGRAKLTYSDVQQIQNNYNNQQPLNNTIRQHEDDLPF